MKESSVFTRYRAGLDRRVWLTLIIVAVLSAGLLAFKIGTIVPCRAVDITARAADGKRDKSFFAGESIHFSANMVKAKSFSWDFGDGTASAEGDTISHTFQHEGNYVVIATLNGTCAGSYTINIQQITSTTNIEAAMVTADPIYGPDAPMTNTDEVYVSNNRAGTYEWTVLNQPQYPVQTGATAKYNFVIPGKLTLQLKLDNNGSKIYQKEITVLANTAQPQTPAAGGTMPKPLPMPQPIAAPASTGPAPAAQPETTAPKILNIPDQEFTNMFQAVKEGEKDAQAFAPYLCNGVQTQVIANGETSTVQAFCSKIANKKCVTIKEVKVIRNAANCVTLLQINYKKKTFCL